MFILKILITAALASLAQFKECKEEPQRLAIDTWFTYNLTTNIGFDVPGNFTYTGSDEPSNPAGGSDCLVAIKVDVQTEVYGIMDSFPGKPKVDIKGSGTIHDAIVQALSTHTSIPGRVLLGKCN